MALLNTFDPATTKATLDRLNKLTTDTKPQWGKMNAGQMLAHLNVAYDLAYGKTGKKPGFFLKIMLKMFVKNGVVGEKPYPKNNRTAPDFVIEGDRDFDEEKTKLIAYIKDTEAKGTTYFEGLDYINFGPLTSKEWSNLLYKHLDHHLTQFGL